MSQSPLVYEAEIYKKPISYRNFKGEVQERTLTFCLDPLSLLELISSFEPKRVKSGNPARNGTTEVTSEQQLQFVRKIACKAAGWASEDGETWTVWEDFEDDLAGKAFLTKLASSDGDRKDFAEIVLLAPFRGFVNFAKVDPTNSPADVAMFEKQLGEMENIFRVPEQKDLTVEERRALLEAQLQQLGETGPAEGTSQEERNS